jgi:hypothetical protein
VVVVVVVVVVLKISDSSCQLIGLNRFLKKLTGQGANVHVKLPH